MKWEKKPPCGGCARAVFRQPENSRSRFLPQPEGKVKSGGRQKNYYRGRRRETRRQSGRHFTKSGLSPIVAATVFLPLSPIYPIDGNRWQQIGAALPPQSTIQSFRQPEKCPPTAFRLPEKTGIGL
jgi:hypothetical protein